MTSIPFTQYLRPSGQRKTIIIDRPDEVAKAALALIDDGYAFEAEVLSNGVVSLTFVGRRPDTGERDDLAFAIVADDERIPGAVDQLVKDAVMIREEHRRTIQ